MTNDREVECRVKQCRGTKWNSYNKEMKFGRGQSKEMWREVAEFKERFIDIQYL